MTIIAVSRSKTVGISITTTVLKTSISLKSKESNMISRNSGLPRLRMKNLRKLIMNTLFKPARFLSKRKFNICQNALSKILTNF